jgi:hypothetical protein
VCCRRRQHRRAAMHGSKQEGHAQLHRCWAGLDAVVSERVVGPNKSLSRNMLTRHSTHHLFHVGPHFLAPRARSSVQDNTLCISHPLK